MQKIYENDEFVCIHRFSRIANKDVFYEVLTAITYENGKVITQQMVRQELDYDPSKGQDWNWEDYEWLDWWATPSQQSNQRHLYKT